MSWLNEVRFAANGLVPVIAQDAISGRLLMVAYANRQALDRTMESGRAHYWSRSRGELWAKGDTSGHVQDVVEVRLDCDGDAVLYLVRQTGPACHTGAPGCFFRRVEGNDLVESVQAGHVLDRIDQVVDERQTEPRPGSYTNYLLEEGVDKILKKVGEEGTEVVIAAKNESDAALSSEVADLLFHLIVLFRVRNLPLDAVWKELDERFGRKPRSLPSKGGRPEE